MKINEDKKQKSIAVIILYGKNLKTIGIKILQNIQEYCLSSRVLGLVPYRRINQVIIIINYLKLSKMKTKK